MSKSKNIISVGTRSLGEGQKVYVIAEIGINHNGSLEVAKKLIDGAALAGCDAVKFQKRTPELCVPKDQWQVERETPWGRMTYIDYRRRIEFGEKEYSEIATYCKQKKIDWFASCWDEASVDFLEKFSPPLYKAASASLTDHSLLNKMKKTGKPLMISTGMSSLREIKEAVNAIGTDNLLIAHSTSTYPCQPNELNLKMIHTLQELFPANVIGYSGHETGLIPTCSAVSMGACFVERHITLDRSMWGSDQSASVEMVGLYRMVQYIRDIEQALGDGIKKVYESEIGPMKRLRKVISSNELAAGL